MCGHVQRVQSDSARRATAVRSTLRRCRDRGAQVRLPPPREQQWRTPQLLDDRRQVVDLAAAVACARAIPGIDPERVAAWGFSQGGGIVIQVAANDRELAAAVAFFPMADGLAFALATSPSVGVRLMVAAVRDRFGQQPVRVPVIGPPGTVAVLTQPAAQTGLDHVLADDSLWRNEVCARPFLRTGRFRPVRLAHRVRCPLLVSLAEDDTLVPLKPIVRVAERAPHATLNRYPLDHFDAFVEGAGFDAVVDDHVEFLTQQLTVGRGDS